MQNDSYQTRMAEQLTKWAEVIGGSAWGADNFKPRIYMPSRRDKTVYFEFPDFPTGDDTDCLGGAKLVVLIDDCGQHANWYAAEKRKTFLAMMNRSLALAALTAGDEQLARDIADEQPELGETEVNEVANHLVNGRLAEARAVLGLVLEE